MTATTTKRPDSLTSDPLWIQASQLCEYGYGQLGSLPDEEKWDMTARLRQHAFGLTDDLAQALGSIDPRDQLHYAGSSRRRLYGLKNVLTMAKRAGYLRLDPDMMLQFESLITAVTDIIDTSKSAIQEYLKIFDHKIELTGKTNGGQKDEGTPG